MTHSNVFAYFQPWRDPEFVAAVAEMDPRVAFYLGVELGKCSDVLVALAEGSPGDSITLAIDSRSRDVFAATAKRLRLTTRVRIAGDDQQWIAMEFTKP